MEIQLISWVIWNDLAMILSSEKIQLSRQMPKVVKLAKRIFRENHLEGDVFLCSEAPKKGIFFFVKGFCLSILKDFDCSLLIYVDFDDPFIKSSNVNRVARPTNKKETSLWGCPEIAKSLASGTSDIDE